MTAALALSLDLVEQGLMPDGVVRLGVRRLLRRRLDEVRADDTAGAARVGEAFFAAMGQAALAPFPDMANRQHYELPAAFFGAVLGPHRKYSSGFWPPGVVTLEQAESAALALTCERAGLADGQRILELGCGWGSLTLWMAQRYPRARILALSNSRSQRRVIEDLARRRGLSNVRVATADFNRFDTDERFDRIVSVEMFEHLRNWPHAFANVARWLDGGGAFLLHVFVHGGAPYAFADRTADDWMSRHFFSGGMMPSEDLALRCQDELRLRQRWRWDGTHYRRTAEAWLARMDAARAELMPEFERIYGAEAPRWWQRWRVFFIAVSEMFGYEGGQRWWVSHYLFEKRR